MSERHTAPPDPHLHARRLRRRRWRRHWIYDPLLAALNYPLHHLFRVLPIEWGSAIGGALGVLNGRYRLHTVRERARRGYRQLSGEGVTAADAERAMDRMFDHHGRVMAEFSVLHRLRAEGRIAVDGEEHPRAARAAGRPVIVMGVHTGNWEVIGPTLVGLGLRFKFIYQPPRSRFEHHIAVRARQRYGADLLRPGVAAARAAYRLLVAERGVLLIYADDERRGYVNAPLFGRPVGPRANLTTIARLALASGAAVIPTYAERLGGARFRVTFLPPVELIDQGDPALTLAENVRRLDRVITPSVLARLEQWYMLVDFYRD